MKGKVLRRLEDQLLPVPQGGRKRPKPGGRQEAKESSQGPCVRNPPQPPHPRWNSDLGQSSHEVTDAVIEGEMEVPKTSWPFPDTSVPAPAASPDLAPPRAYSRGTCFWGGLGLGWLPESKHEIWRSLQTPKPSLLCACPPRGLGSFSVFLSLPSSVCLSLS